MYSTNKTKNKNYNTVGTVPKSNRKIVERVRVMVFNATQWYFSYSVAVSFNGGGNQSTRRKPPTCCKSLTNLLIFSIVYSVCPKRIFN